MTPSNSTEDRQAKDGVSLKVHLPPTLKRGTYVYLRLYASGMEMHNLKERVLTCEKVVTVFDIFASCSSSLIAWGSFENSIAPTDTQPELGCLQNRGHLRTVFMFYSRT